MSKVKFIPRHYKTKCYICNGKGCGHCDDKGTYAIKTWFLVYENNKGQKQAFLVDTLK